MPEEPQIDPRELRAVQIPRAMRGYSTRAVDALREHLATGIEQLLADRDRLQREVDQAERARKELAEALVEVTGEREALVSSFHDATLERQKLLESFEQMTRERQELHDRVRGLEAALGAAERRAELIIGEAHADARKLVLEVEREIFATNAQLRSVLEKLERMAAADEES